MSQIKYKITLNKSRKTYTIKRYINGRLIYPYFRSYPQGREFSENWTENDIINFLHTSTDYYCIDKNN